VVIGDAGPGIVGSRLSGDGGSVTGLVLDDTGRGVALFSNLGDPADSLRIQVRALAANFNPPGAWSPPVFLRTEEAPWENPNALAGDGQGGAIAAWQRTVGTASDLHASRYVVAGGWQPALLVAPLVPSTNAPRAQILEGTDGAALVAWTDTELRAARIPAAGAAEEPTALGPPAFFFALAGTPTEALLAFVDEGRLLFSLLDSGGGWTPAVEVPGAGTVAVGALGGFAAAAEGPGRFALAWFRADASGNPAGVQSARYAAATGWSGPVVIGGSADPGERAVRLAASPQGGHLLAYWIRGDGRLWGNRYTPGSGWGSAAPVSSATPLAQAGLPPGTSAAAGVAAAIDGAGNALVLWAEGGTRLLSARASSAGAWSAGQALPLEAGTRGIVGPLALSMNSAGQALAAWAQPRLCATCPAPREVWAALYEPR
jgi:hypothetical protein